MRRKNQKPKFIGSAIPIGSCVRTDNDMFYIQEKARLRIPSDAVYRSWSFPYTLYSDASVLSKLPIIGNLGFRPGTVIYSLEDGLYYLIEKNVKRQITDPRWFDWIGIDRLDVTVASLSDIRLHKTGEVL